MDKLILNKIITNIEYSKSIFPFIKLDYFTNTFDKKIMNQIFNYYQSYQKLPSFDEIEHDIKDTYPENVSDSIVERLEEIKQEEKEILVKKLVNDSETYFKNVAVQNAIIKCAEIIQTNKIEDFQCFPDLLKDALKISFNTTIGINFKFKDDIEQRFNDYITRPDKIELSTKLLNFITDGGFEKETLNLYFAPTNVGKTWKLVDDAAFFFRAGYNVLYVTLEMSQAKIMQRIETNLFQLPTNKFKDLTFKGYLEYLKSVKPFPNKKLGNLIVKQFPTSMVNKTHIDQLLDELELKQNFKADILIVDYLGILQPVSTTYANSYEKGKIVSEDLRGLAVEKKICIISAVQTNRSGFNTSDFDLKSISESVGSLFVVDFVCALIRDEDLDETNEMWIKPVKNRYQPIVNKKFNIGTNIDTQSFFDAEQGADSDFTEEKIKELEEKKKNFSTFKFD